MWDLVVTVSVSSGFSSLMCSESVVFLCPLQSFCPAKSSGVNHNSTAKGWLLSSPSLAGSQTWVSSTTRGRRLTLEAQPLYLIQWEEPQGWGHLRANPEFGYSGSSPSWLSLSLANLLYREDFLQSIQLFQSNWNNIKYFE